MQTEAKFTKGPWRVEYGHQQKSGPRCWQVSDEYDAVCNNQFCCARESEANAHLIAAAPDLYAALHKALNFIENTEGELGVTLDSGDAARAALRKARGEA